MEKTTRQRLRGGLAASLVLGGTLVATAALPAPPAGALTSRCKATYVCLFINPNYDRVYASYAGNDDTYSNNTFDYCSGSNCELNDSVSSIDNDGTQLGTRHYVHYVGAPNNPSFYIAQGGYRATLASTYDDDLTAHRWG